MEPATIQIHLPGVPYAPRRLWVLGARPPWGRCLASVGTREPSANMRSRAARLCHALAGAGWTVVSGLAFGIDAASHAGALAAGRTVAVLGSGVDIISPAANRPLAEQILATGGAIVSEQPPGTRAFAGNLVQRNRLITGLSEALILWASAIDGGAMHAARFARAQGRPIWVPRRLQRGPRSLGPKTLLAQGLAREFEDEEPGEFLKALEAADGV